MHEAKKEAVAVKRQRQGPIASGGKFRNIDSLQPALKGGKQRP